MVRIMRSSAEFKGKYKWKIRGLMFSMENKERYFSPFFFLKQLPYKTQKYFLLSLKSVYPIKDLIDLLSTLWPRNVILKDLGTIPLKCKHQGRWYPISQLLMDIWSLTLVAFLHQVAKLPPVINIWEVCFSSG